MTAREQRQQRRRARAIRRRVSRVLAFLALLAALVLIVAARAKDKTGEAVLPETDPLPLATVTTIETAPPVTLAPVAESEAVSRYAGIEISDEDVYTSLASPITRRGASRSRDRSPLSRSRSIGACPTTSRIRSRRSYFRSTAMYGSSPRSLPLHGGADGDAVRGRLYRTRGGGAYPPTRYSVLFHESL